MSSSVYWSLLSESFIACSDDENLIRSEEAWDAFLYRLLHCGAIQKSEVWALERIWADLVVASTAFHSTMLSKNSSSGRPSLSLEQLKRLIILHHGTNAHENVLETAGRLHHDMERLSEGMTNRLNHLFPKTSTTQSIDAAAITVTSAHPEQNVSVSAVDELRATLQKTNALAKKFEKNIMKPEKNYTTRETKALNEEGVRNTFWEDSGVARYLEEITVERSTLETPSFNSQNAENEFRAIALVGNVADPWDWQRRNQSELTKRTEELSRLAKHIEMPSFSAFRKAYTSSERHQHISTTATAKNSVRTVYLRIPQHTVVLENCRISPEYHKGRTSKQCALYLLPSGAKRICSSRAYVQTFKELQTFAAAHRQLLLSKRFLDVYGSVQTCQKIDRFVGKEYPGTIGLFVERCEDLVPLEVFLAFYREHSSIHDNRASLDLENGSKRNGVRGLTETSKLFRFLASELIFAFCDLCEMSTMRLQEPPSEDNVFVTKDGSRLVIGNLKFAGDVALSNLSLKSNVGTTGLRRTNNTFPNTISSQSSKTSVLRFVETREKMLIGALGRILEFMLQHTSSIDDTGTTRSGRTGHTSLAHTDSSVEKHLVSPRLDDISQVKHFDVTHGDMILVKEGQRFSLHIRTSAPDAVLQGSPVVKHSVQRGDEHQNQSIPPRIVVPDTLKQSEGEPFLFRALAVGEVHILVYDNIRGPDANVVEVKLSIDTSVDRVLQNVSTWYTIDECIPLHLFIHGIFVVLDGGVNPAKVFTTALEATLECHDLVSFSSTDEVFSSTDQLAPLPPGAAEFDTFSSLMKHKCFSPQYCVPKERSKEFSLRTLQSWGTKVHSSVDTSVDRVLQNVSTWYTTDECIPLHIFIHGVLVVLDRGVNPAKVFLTAQEATLQCSDFVNILTHVNERSMIHESKKEVSTHDERQLARNVSKIYHDMNKDIVPLADGRGRRLNSCPQVSSQCATTLNVSDVTALKNAVTAAKNGGTYVQVSQNISFSGTMQSSSALVIDSATIAIVGQGGMKELKGQGSSGNYRIFSIRGSSSKVHLEKLKIMNGY
eukprot:g1431.t1